MSKPTTNWNSPETWQRVIASILATGVKIDLKAAAKYYGTTYDTLENRFRQIKKDAKVLQEEVDSGKRGEVTPMSTPKKKTPRKDVLGGVSSGRVTKPKASTRKNVKQEFPSGDEADVSAAGSHHVETPADSMFDYDAAMSFDIGVDGDYF